MGEAVATTLASNWTNQEPNNDAASENAKGRLWWPVPGRGDEGLDGLCRRHVERPKGQAPLDSTPTYIE